MIIFKSFAMIKELAAERLKTRVAMLVLACILFAAAGPGAQAWAESDSSGSILAEKVTPSELKEGDRLVIVCEANDMVLCNQAVPNNATRLSSGKAETANTATRKVLTRIPENAAVFQLSEGENGVYLQCDAGYLTSSATGNALYYASEKEDGSRWQFKEDAFLYNPSAVSTSGTYTYRNYYVEFFSSYFTVYGKRASSSVTNFAMSIYRMGNSLPEEPLLQESYYYLPVYDTSDVHGYLANVTENGDVQYLMAYISDRVNAARGGRKDKVVLLDGGDIYQGTTMSNMTKGHALSAAYALMDYDAVALGNHEFDWGLENTVDSDGTMEDYNLGDEWQGVNDTPVVISNLYQNGSKIPWGRDYIILEKTAADANGNELPVKIGVIGLAGDYGSSILTKEFGDKGYSIRLDLDEVNALAEQLESSGMCDATILLAHDSAGSIANGLTEDTAIDLVLGGHTHYNVCEKTAWGLRYIEPSCYGKAYGRVDLAFSASEGTPHFEQTANERVYAVPAKTDSEAKAGRLDPQIVALTDHVVGMLSTLLESKVGTVTESVLRLTYIEGSGNRSTTCGNWISSILARAYGADAGIVNSGGLRVEFPVDSGKGERDISISDVYTMFPFDNRIYLFELTYEELLSALEYGLTSAGSRLVSEISGITCYYSDGHVNGIVNGDGTVVYADGVWKDDWRTKILTVSVNEYIVTTDRKEGNVSNPFCTWKDTKRLLASDKIDNVTAIEVLESEAAVSGGYLAVDTAPHFILGHLEVGAGGADDGNADNGDAVIGEEDVGDAVEVNAVDGNADAGDADAGGGSGTRAYLEQVHARKQAFDGFDEVGDYTTENLSFVRPSAEKIAAFVNDIRSICEGIDPMDPASDEAVRRGGLGILRKFGLCKQDPGVGDARSSDGQPSDGQSSDGQQSDGQQSDAQQSDGQQSDTQTSDGLKNVPIDIENAMSEVQTVGLEAVDLRCLTAAMNETARINGEELYTQGVASFDNALTALETDAEILQRMVAQGAIAAERQGRSVPTGNCSAGEEFDFNTLLVETITAEEGKGGKAAEPFRGFEDYVEDLRNNFTLVAGAVAQSEAANPIIRYDKCWNTYFNFETQGYYLRQAYRSGVAYQLTRAFGLLEICCNIFDPGTAGAQTALCDQYVQAIEALESMPAGQSPEEIDRKIDRSAGNAGDGTNGGNTNFRVYCPTFNCDFTDLSLQWKLVGNEVPDEQLEEFVSRLHGRNLEEELKLAGLWGDGAAGGWTALIDGQRLEYSGGRLLWDGMMYGDGWNSDASKSNYSESGHGIGFNGREKDGKIYTDIIDATGTLRREVLTFQEAGYGPITSTFDLPAGMEQIIYLPYIHFTMEAHVG